MQSFFHKIDALKFGWNDRPLDEGAFNKLTRKLKIKVKSMPLTVNGFYSCVKGRHFIAVDSRLSRLQAEFVMYHELAHFIMHSPSTDSIDNYCGSPTNSRDEKEADAFAYCAVLPLTMLKKVELEDLSDMYGSGFLMRRLEVYERYGI